MLKKNQLLLIILSIFIFPIIIASCNSKLGKNSSGNNQQASSNENRNNEKGSEDAALGALTKALSDILEGKSIVPSGEDEINGEHCWKFAIGSRSDDKFTAEDHFAVTDDGKVYVLNIESNIYVLYHLRNGHMMPLLRMDVTGMENLDEDVSYLFDEVLYISLESYYPFVSDEDYNKESMLARMKVLEGDDIQLISLSYSGEPNKDYSGGLGYGTWNVKYQAKKDKETMYCSDIYFRTSFGEYRVHTMVPVDKAEKYKNEIKQRFETIVLLPPLTIDQSGLRTTNTLGTEYSGEILYVKLQSFASLMDKNEKIKSINKDNITQIINKLEGPPYEESGFIGAREVNFSISEEYSKLLTYPSYLVKYTLGRNEDTMYCTDLFFQTDSGYYRVHISYDPDAVDNDNKKEVESDIKRILSSVSLDTHYTDMRYQ